MNCRWLKQTRLGYLDKSSNATANQTTGLIILNDKGRRIEIWKIWKMCIYLVLKLDSKIIPTKVEVIYMSITFFKFQPSNDTFLTLGTLPLTWQEKVFFKLNQSK